jgi:acetyltransferase-like isoleucine patch superfamily enzyme
MPVIANDWYPSQVPDGVALGERTWIDSSIAFIHHRSVRRPSIRVGSDSGIYRGTYFDLGAQGEVRLGSYSSMIGAVISTGGRVVIGDYVFIGYATVLADYGDALPPPSRERLGLSSRASPAISIGDNVWIGTRVTILGGTEIGRDAVIGAGAVVDAMRVPPGKIVAGNPARIVGSVERS